MLVAPVTLGRCELKLRSEGILIQRMRMAEAACIGTQYPFGVEASVCQLVLCGFYFEGTGLVQAEMSIL